MINLDVNYITNGLIGANDTIYFTVTNSGYLDYTLNMLKSLHYVQHVVSVFLGVIL